MMRDVNSQVTQLVKLLNHFNTLITYLLFLVSDTDMSSGKPSTEHKRHKESHNTAGKVIELYCVCYYFLSSIISFGTFN